MTPSQRAQAQARSILGWFSRLPVQILLALSVLWVVIEFVALGRFSMVVTGDNITIIPYLQAFYDNEIPFTDWSPFPAAGTDMIATGYATLINRWVFGIFPSWLAFEILAVGPVVAGVLGTYGLCRRVFGLDERSSVFAGFLYVVSFADAIFVLRAVLGYLPLTILALGHLLDEKTDAKRWLVVIAAGFLISHTPYFSRLVPWAAAAFFVWFLVVEKRRQPIDWAIIILFSIAIMAARWQDFIALWAYSPFSALSDFRYDLGLSGYMGEAINALQGYLFGKGYLTLVFLVVFALSFRNNRHHKSLELSLALCAFVALLFLAGLFKTVLVPVLPFLSGYKTTHIMQGFGLIAAIAGGVGFQHLIKIARDQKDNPGKMALLGRLLPAAGVVLIIAFSLTLKAKFAQDWVSWGNFHQNTQSPVFKDLANRIRAKGEPERALFLQWQGNFLNAYGIEVFSSYHPMVSRRYRRFWIKLTEGWQKQPVGKEGKTITGPKLSLVPTDHKPEWRLADLVNLDLLSFANGGFVISRDRIIDEDLELISGPDRPWTSLSRKEKILTSIKANFTGRKHVYVYRNPNVFPRAFTARKIRVLDSWEQVLDALGRADRETLAGTVFVERDALPPDLPANAALAKTRISLKEYKGDRIVVGVEESSQPTVLIVTNAYSPFWTVRIDGTEAKIFPADYAFWGVVVPAGSKEVVFEYRPPYR